MKPKILFIQPDYNRFFIPYMTDFEPLCFEILASCINDIAEVEIMDRRIESEEIMRNKIRSFKPDIVGSRTHSSAEIITAKKILEIAKEIDPSITTIIGGQHPTLMPHDFYEDFIDLICVGPGEDLIREVVLEYSSGKEYEKIKGLGINNEGEIFLTPNRHIESGVLKWPKIDRSYSNKYRRRFPLGFILTSIGCPYRCKFCALWVSARGTYRIRPAEDIVNELAEINQSHIYIGDDNTFHNVKHAFEVAKMIQKRGIKKNFLGYARTDTIVENPELFAEWSKAGLFALIVGFESIREDRMGDINKSNSVKINLEAKKILNKSRILPLAHFIIFPDFEKRDFEELWNFIRTNDITAPVFVPLTPLPGTELFEKAKAEDSLSVFDISFYNLEYMVYKTKMPKKEFYEEYMKLWRKQTTISHLIRRFRIERSPLLISLALHFSVLKADPIFQRNIKIQLELEKHSDYAKLEPTLLPSFRRSYRVKRDDI
ncbi:B12-binding domain-containing radical SAM protein [Candidatus Omnitrophota bacterium]